MTQNKHTPKNTPNYDQEFSAACKAEVKELVKRILGLKTESKFEITMRGITTYGNPSELCFDIVTIRAMMRMVQNRYSRVHIASFYTAALYLEKDSKLSTDHTARRTNLILDSMVVLGLFKTFDPLTLMCELNSPHEDERVLSYLPEDDNEARLVAEDPAKYTEEYRNNESMRTQLQVLMQQATKMLATGT